MSSGFRNAEWGLSRTPSRNAMHDALTRILMPETLEEHTAQLPVVDRDRVLIRKRLNPLRPPDATDDIRYTVHYEPLCTNKDPEHQIWATDSFEELISYVWGIALLFGEKTK